MINKKELIQKIKSELLKNLYNDVQEVILFGSNIQNNINENSDYDILIISKNKYNWKDKEKILSILYGFNLKYDILLDIHILSNEELNNSARGNQPVFKNAIKYGVHT
jgi:predicted nucleotidyltransferase